ncbi:MAG: alkaline phosphatase family protein [candidate division KSB1 bacterium]|nr:alkaline phosphatase family protein [candidate division KSB1 bacterium]MDZ7304114.1 alkaline phosphatase family protein [candidate division KSB1 bacterium]MDZ7313389.1 alkaline phosphatase family protein [candidate division KSB1 bacterium]
MKTRWQRFVFGMLLILGLILPFGCSRWFGPSVPRLAIVIVVDQMRYDHLVRYHGLFSGGFAKLLQEGAVFTNVHHDHAGTETAPGHATLATGSYPSHHGIIGNSWYDRHTGREIYSVEDSNSPVITSGEKSATPSSSPKGKSPRNLLRHTLGDWLKAKYSQAKVISISGKDRSAIVMAGFDAEAAYWYYPPIGGFVSSRYYLEALPAWAAKWNAERHADRYYNKAWDKSRPETDYFVSREDLFSAENDGEHTTFPHQFLGEEVTAASTNAVGPKFYDWISNTPFVDELTLEFAQQAVQFEQLGADGTPDLLMVSLKATDAIGHAFGPLSQESEDNLLRLDAGLAQFFNFLEKQVGLQNCLIALCSDHGVLPLPEELRRRGFEAARIPGKEAVEEVLGVEKEMQQEWRTKRRILRTRLGEINLDYHVADSLGLSPSEFRSRVAAKLRTLSFVSEVYTSDELRATGGAEREYLDKQRHSFHPERASDLIMQLKPYYLVSGDSYGTTHGSPYEYDTHVPMIFWGKRVKPGVIDTPHKTVDLAPTMAHLLNLDLPADFQKRVANGRPGSAQIESGADGQILKMAIKE